MDIQSNPHDKFQRFISTYAENRTGVGTLINLKITIKKVMHEKTRTAMQM